MTSLKHSEKNIYTIVPHIIQHFIQNFFSFFSNIINNLYNVIYFMYIFNDSNLKIYKKIDFITMLMNKWCLSVLCQYTQTHTSLTDLGLGSLWIFQEEWDPALS